MNLRFLLLENMRKLFIAQLKVSWTVSMMSLIAHLRPLLIRSNISWTLCSLLSGVFRILLFQEKRKLWSRKMRIFTRSSIAYGNIYHLFQSFMIKRATFSLVKHTAPVKSALPSGFLHWQMDGTRIRRAIAELYCLWRMSSIILVLPQKQD